MRPRERCALISSRMRGSSSTSSFGRLIEISLCLRLMELSSTVNLNPSFAASPRPYPVMDLMQSSFQTKIAQQCKHRGPQHKRIQWQPQDQHQNITLRRRKPLPRFDREDHSDDYAERDQGLVRHGIEPPNLATTRAQSFSTPKRMRSEEHTSELQSHSFISYA